MTTEQEQNLADAEITLIKIGFIGAGGTGKTSVARILLHLPEPFVASRNREVFALLGHNGESFQAANTPQENWRIQRALIDMKIDQDTTHPVGLFDRTPIDHIAYCLHRCADGIPDHEWEWLWGKYTGLIDLYDLLVYFPIYDWGTSHEDGFRQGNKAYRTKVDLLMQGVMVELGIYPVEMANISPEARAEFLMPHIEEAREAKRERLRAAQSYQDGPLG